MIRTVLTLVILLALPMVARAQAPSCSGYLYAYGQNQAAIQPYLADAQAEVERISEARLAQGKAALLQNFLVSPGLAQMLAKLCANMPNETFGQAVGTVIQMTSF